MSDRTSTDEDDPDDIDPEGEIDESLIPTDLWAEIETELDQYESELRRSMAEHFDNLDEDDADVDFDDAEDIDFP